jgi:hypothetical protein
LIGIAKALNIGEHPCLDAKLHGTSNNGGDNLTEEHRAICDLHVVGQLEIARKLQSPLHGIITPCLEQHHRNWAARKSVSDDQLRDDVQLRLLVRSGADHTQRESIHEC